MSPSGPRVKGSDPQMALLRDGRSFKRWAVSRLSLSVSFLPGHEMGSSHCTQLSCHRPKQWTNYTQKPPKLWSKLHLFCFQLDYHQHFGTATEQHQMSVLRKLKVSVSSYYSPVKVSSIALTDMYCTVQNIFPCLGPRLFFVQDLVSTWFCCASSLWSLPAALSV